MNLKPIYLYNFTNGDQAFWFTNVGSVQSLDGDEYTPEKISHSKPQINQDTGKSDITISVPFDNPVVLLHSLSPPPLDTEVLIYKFYEGVTDPEVHWRGRVLKPSQTDSNAQLECGTTLSHLLSLDGLPENHQILCNKRLGDGRCPVNLENFRLTVTVTDASTSDLGVSTVTVTGITQPEGWFERGKIQAPNGDYRFIVAHVGGLLTLDHAFPADTLAEDDTPDIFPGCDLAYATCIGKFGSETGNGDAFGGEPTIPNTNPHDFGRMV